MCQIPCKCTASVYIGESIECLRLEKAKVRLTKKDIEDGNKESTEVRVGKEDRGLAKHRTQLSGNRLEKFKNNNNR